jgi:hypothetical protein
MHHELAGSGQYGRLFPRHHVTDAGAAKHNPSTRTPADQSSSLINVAEQELIRKLQEAGYTRVRDVRSTAEGIVAKAVKDGKEVSLVVDSNGKFRER